MTGALLSKTQVIAELTCVVSSTYMPLMIISLFLGHHLFIYQKHKTLCFIYFYFFTPFSIPLGSVE